jgi:hypothetical protein
MCCLSGSASTGRCRDAPAVVLKLSEALPPEENKHVETRRTSAAQSVEGLAYFIETTMTSARKWRPLKSSSRLDRLLILPEFQPPGR